VTSDTSETYAGTSWLPEGIHVHYTSTTTASAADTLSRTTAPAAAQQQFRPVQQNRPGFQVGGQSSSTSGTRTTGLKKGCWTCGEPHYQRDCPVERARHPDQPDPLQWEIWARPIGFMQW
jgi:hypothetical protein